MAYPVAALRCCRLHTSELGYCSRRGAIAASRARKQALPTTNTTRPRPQIPRLAPSGRIRAGCRECRWLVRPSNNTRHRYCSLHYDYAGLWAAPSTILSCYCVLITMPHPRSPCHTPCGPDPALPPPPARARNQRCWQRSFRGGGLAEDHHAREVDRGTKSRPRARRKLSVLKSGKVQGA